MKNVVDIPHVIHYCWFGGQPLGPNELKCIESWRNFFPGYDIVRWDESNFDIHCCTYVSQAYDAKKWAFVSDYARFAILYKYGGLYFDTDVEIIRPIDDIVAKGPFMGFETDANSSGNGCTVAPGLGLSANPGLGLYRDILDSYEADEFIGADGILNMKTVVIRTTDILRSYGLKNEPGIQEIAGVVLYPSEYFNPKDFLTGEVRITSNTRAIHHFGQSWYSEEEKFEYKITSWCVKRGVSSRTAHRIGYAIRLLRYADFKRACILMKKYFSKGDDK